MLKDARIEDDWKTGFKNFTKLHKLTFFFEKTRLLEIFKSLLKRNSK
jgi:hypothetical protein